MYVTTYCNFPHDEKTGKPIGHTCYVLNPRALRAEIEGDFETALRIGIVKEPRREMTGRRNEP